jgi:hypothetical protein
MPLGLAFPIRRAVAPPVDRQAATTPRAEVLPEPGEGPLSSAMKGEAATVIITSFSPS